MVPYYNTRYAMENVHLEKSWENFRENFVRENWENFGGKYNKFPMIFPSANTVLLYRHTMCSQLSGQLYFH